MGTRQTKKHSGVDQTLRFFLINDRKNRVREVVLSKRWIWSGLGVMLIAFITVTGLALAGATDARYSVKVASLKNQNAELVKILEDMKVRLSDAETQLADLVDRDEALRVYADLPDIDTDIRAMGTGGTVTELQRTYDDLIPSSDLHVSELEGNLSALTRAITLQRNSYEQIYQKLQSDINRLRYVPSISPVRKGYLTSAFGIRHDPFTRELRPHHGQDFGVLTGTPVYATADGVVKARQGRTGYGKTIVLDHGYGIKTFYAHLDQYLVRPGDQVERGQMIALSGNTGRSTGPHLHYEVRVNNIPVNPRHYFLTGKIEL